VQYGSTMDNLKSKRSALPAILSLMLLIPGIAAAKPAAKNEPDAEVRARAESFLATWNHHDSKAMAAYWAPEGDLINMYGRVAKGRDAIADNLAGEHATDMRLATMTTSSLAVRTIEPSVALADWDVDVSGVLNPDATAAPPVKEHWTILLQRTNGTWWFTAARVSSFLTTPPVVR
jgi:uncharacterized protein (TIGR02246 family)